MSKTFVNGVAKMGRQQPQELNRLFKTMEPDVEERKRPSETLQTKFSRVIKSLLGVSLALSSGMCLGLSGVFSLLAVKSGITEIQILLVQSICMVVVSLPFVCYLKLNLLPSSIVDRVILLSMGILENLANLAYYYSMTYISGVGDVTAIYCAAVPVFTPLMASLVLREPWKPVRHGISTVLSLVGILLISFPSILANRGKTYTNIDVFNDSVGYTLAVLCAFGLCTNAVLARAFTTDVSIFTISIYSGLVGTPVSLALNFIKDNRHMVPINTAEVIGTLFGKIGFYVMYFAFRYRSLHYEAATTVVLLGNIEIVAAYIGDVLLFQNTPTLVQLVGVGLVVVSAVLVAFMTGRAHVREAREWA
ncbi:solute carrier family 35 member G1-like [Saccoglossus kowalevskii]|uniref:Solute carrier family 35 member G2-like n=1 Tax=Saccoglossus kowalevskii TaxID=10224 RepID=A0ABM0N082_SACKO|nr:PREDICTED: solute carrier family 35 member G2-like [Saccoglossus kowalevskii]